MGKHIEWEGPCCFKKAQKAVLKPKKKKISCLIKVDLHKTTIKGEGRGGRETNENILNLVGIVKRRVNFWGGEM